VIHGELEMRTWTSSYFESKSPGTIDPGFNFLLTHDAYLIKSRWGRKSLIVVSSHIQYYEYTMPRMAMNFT
jgi:hypothetical protein